MNSGTVLISRAGIGGPTLAFWLRAAGFTPTLIEHAFCLSLMAGQGSAMAMTAAYVLAGELARANGCHETAFAKYEERLRAYIASKQQGAERFAAAFAPKSRWGLFLRNQVMKAFAIPGLARAAFGRDIFDTLQLPEFRWPAFASDGGPPDLA